MSSRERQRRLKRARVLCAACQARKARFRYRGRVRANRDHTLCFECYRREIDRTRARRLTESARPSMRSPLGSFVPSGERMLDGRQVAHRQRMLDHLQCRAVATS